MAAKKKAKKKASKKVAKKASKGKASATGAKKKASKKKAAKKAPKAKVNYLPPGYTNAMAVMNQDDAKATIEFCKKAFGAKLRTQMPGPGGKLMHAEITIGDSIVMLSDAVMEPARVSSIMLFVPDVDKTVAKAVAAGATVTMPVADQFWGDRFGRVTDPFGNNWSIATHIEDVSPAEMAKRGKAAMANMPSP